jgi:phosphoglycerate kinase
LAKYEKGERPVLFIFGGAKIKDSLELMGIILASGKADNVCIGGLLGQLFLKATGKNLGETEKTFEEKGFNPLVEKAQQLLSSFKEKIILPIDLAVVDEDDERLEITVEELPTDFLIGDIGMETVALFKKQVHKAKLIVFNGPVGMFEKYGLELATKKVLESVSKSKAFSIIGGGDTVDALRELEFMPTQFSHVSLGGKALLQYLSGQPLPGLQALQK